MNSSPWRSNYTKILSCRMNIYFLVSPVKVGETGIPSNSWRNPISKDRIPERKSLIQKKTEAPVSCYGCELLLESFDQDATLATVRQKDYALSSSLNQSNFYSFLVKNASSIDFLTAAGIVLDLQRKQWYFTETSHRKYNFVKAPPNINALLTVDPEPHLLSTSEK
ncbi:hypothetical protein TNCV_4013191 [Trichonephila clavipes]|nr:hypothetical protein TNCV_4013191 [Trichonephila clavipes]